MRFPILPAVLVLLLAGSLFACGQVDEADAPPPEEAQVTATAELSSVPTLIPDALAIQPLLIWIPDEVIRPVSEDAYAPFEAPLHEYQETLEGSQVDLRIKDADASGGILSILKDAQEVAPAAVPDLMLLNGSNLLDATAEGRLHEWLDLPEEAIIDIPNLLLSAGQIDGLTYGIPFRFAVTHLHYRQGTLTEEMMVFSYADILERAFPIALPIADDRFMRELLLTQMFHSEKILNETPSPAEWIAALEEIYLFYEMATSQGLLDVSREESASFIQSDDFMIVKAEDPTNQFAAIPNRRGTELAVVDAWFWVLPKSDPARRQMAQQFMLWISDANRQYEGMNPFAAFPASVSHFLTEPQDEYLQFVLAAITQTNEPILLDASFVDLIQRNFNAILRGELSAETALAEIETHLLERN